MEWEEDMSEINPKMDADHLWVGGIIDVEVFSKLIRIIKEYDLVPSELTYVHRDAAPPDERDFSLYLGSVESEDIRNAMGELEEMSLPAEYEGLMPPRGYIWFNLTHPQSHGWSLYYKYTTSTGCASR